MPSRNSGPLGLRQPMKCPGYLIRERYDIYINDEYVQQYLPQGNELDIWNLEQRLVSAGLLPDFVQPMGQRMNIYCSDTKLTALINRYLKVICAIE